MPLRRNTVRQLKAGAAQTLAQTQALLADAKKTLTVTERAALQTLAQVSAAAIAVCEGVEELMDGVTIEGRVKIYGQPLPITGELHIKPREEEKADDGKST